MFQTKAFCSYLYSKAKARAWGFPFALWPLGQLYPRTFPTKVWLYLSSQKSYLWGLLWPAPGALPMGTNPSFSFPLPRLTFRFWWAWTPCVSSGSLFLTLLLPGGRFPPVSIFSGTFSPGPQNGTLAPKNNLGEFPTALRGLLRGPLNTFTSPLGHLSPVPLPKGGGNPNFPYFSLCVLPMVVLSLGKGPKPPFRITPKNKANPPGPLLQNPLENFFGA